MAEKKHINATSSAQISGVRGVGWVAYVNIDGVVVSCGIRTSDLGVRGELRSILRLYYGYLVM